MLKRLLPLFVFAIPLVLVGEDELPKEVLRPAIDSYRHVQRNPFIAKPEGITGVYKKFTISPQALPDPLLRHRLHIFGTEKEAGNALPLYLAALKKYREVHAAAMENLYQSDEFHQLDPADKEYSHKRSQLRFKAFPQYSNWHYEEWLPLSLEEEARFYGRLNDVFLFIEKASKKNYLEWSDIYEYRGFVTKLDFLQEARLIARYLAGKANWEIRSGKYEEAIKTLRVGFAFSDHILESTPPSFLVGLLVGTACKHLICEQLYHLSAQPGAPNLYPALMQMTQAQKSWSNAVQSESLLLIPKYHDDSFWASLDRLTPEQAKASLDELIMLYADSLNWNNENGVMTDNVSLIRTAMLLVSYQPAKKRLLDKGYSEKEINDLSTDQVVFPLVIEELKRAYDLTLVNASMPMGEQHTVINIQEYMERKERAPILHLGDYLLAIYAPSTDGAKAAFYRHQQSLDLLKIVEALRHYAAMHEGQLPKSLDDITEIAVPKICPVTAKPYQYRAEGNTATIDYVISNTGNSDKYRIEVVVDATPCE